MSDMMTFPATVEEFMEQYKIVDDEKVYTNGADLVPIFRMMQWFEHVSATDKNVGTNDTINRQQAIYALCAICGKNCDKSKFVYNAPQDEQVILCPEHYALSTLPSAQPEQHWIPVTVRLPKEDDYRPCYGYEDGAVWWRNDMGMMGLGWYYPSTGKWAYYDESDRCEKCVGSVVEWMPLPEPWKGE